jgi:integrase
MARKNKPKKTGKQNIFEIEGRDGAKEYLATWTQDGHRYIEKNLTKRFGCTTATKAFNKLAEIKVLIAQGKDPFLVNEESDLTKTLTQLVLAEIEDRNAGDEYKYIQAKIYNKHIHPLIGKLKLNELTISTITNMFRKLKKTEKSETITNLKKTINPTLDYAADEGLIESNPLNSRKIKQLTKASAHTGKVPLKHRLVGMDDERYISTARKLYQAALTVTKKSLRKRRGKIPDNELQIAFLLVLMTGRRRSEMLGIKYSDITEYGTVKTRIETTKTSVWEEYPLPEEVLERLEPKGKGKILPTLSRSTYSAYIRKFIDGLDLPLHIDMKIDGHDTRNLFLTIMSKETKNPFLCDRALSHSKSKYKMLLTYYEPDLSDYKELYGHYWDLLRGKRSLTQ